MIEDNDDGLLGQAEYAEQACFDAPPAVGRSRKPSSCFISWGEYLMSRQGLSQQTKKGGKGDDKDPARERISASFEILGECRDPQARYWGMLLRWRDPDGNVRTKNIERTALHGDPAALCNSLEVDGLKVSTGKEKALQIYLSGAPVKGRATIADRTGWHEIGGLQVFVLPNETIGPITAEKVILGDAAVGPYAAKGTLEDWKAGVGALSSGHVLPVLSISAALAGPLLRLVGQEGGGFHLFGSSSKGKSTCAQMAASVWGRGGTPGYVRSWRSTANGLEGAAATASDTVLILDELGVINAQEAAAGLYQLANGAGKARAQRDGSLREPKSWREIVLSTGEITAEAKLREDKRKSRAGQLVRLLDIPADRGFGFGAFDNSGPDGDAGKLSNEIKRAAETAYGTAGIEFVRRIIAEGVDLTSDLARCAILDFMEANERVRGDGQVGRAAQRFGLLAAAGEMATALGITPWEPGEAEAAAAWAFDQWISGRGGAGQAEDRQAIEQVRLFIEQHGSSRFEDLDVTVERAVNNRAGYRKGSGEGQEWLVLPEVWKVDVCAGLDPIFVAKTLHAAGMLKMSGGKLQTNRKIGGADKRVYVITAAIIAGDTPDQSQNADNLFPLTKKTVSLVSRAIVTY